MAIRVRESLCADDEKQLRRHVAVCPNCRDEWKRLKRMTRLLEKCAIESPLPPKKSFWPNLRRIIQRRERLLPTARFEGWKPAVMVLVGWTIVLLFAFRPQPVQPEVSGEAEVLQSDSLTTSSPNALTTPFGFSPLPNVGRALLIQNHEANCPYCGNPLPAKNE